MRHDQWAFIDIIMVRAKINLEAETKQDRAEIPAGGMVRVQQDHDTVLDVPALVQVARGVARGRSRGHVIQCRSHCNHPTSPIIAAIIATQLANPNITSGSSHHPFGKKNAWLWRGATTGVLVVDMEF